MNIGNKKPSASLRPCASMLFVFIGLLQVACTDKAAEPEVLATVNGSEITESELEQMLRRTFGGQVDEMDVDKARDKALEGLVMMRAIAMEQEKNLARAELAEIDIKARHYRDELLVESYLREHAKPYVPTEAGIREYYERHAQRFGAEAVASYEILQVNAEPDPRQLPRLIKQFDEARQQSDWREYAQQLKQQGQPVVLVQGRTDGPPLHASLSQVINGLEAGQVSNVFYLDKKPHIARVIAIEQRPPKPLDEVRGEIRKALAVQHMKTAIAEASKEVLKSADVHYNSRGDAETQSGNENE